MQTCLSVPVTTLPTGRPVAVEKSKIGLLLERLKSIHPSSLLVAILFFFLGNISTPHNLSLIQKNRDPLPLLSFKTQHKTFALRPQYFLIFFIFPLYFSLFLHPDIFSLMSTVLCIQEFHDLHILLDYNFIW